MTCPEDPGEWVAEGSAKLAILSDRCWCMRPEERWRNSESLNRVCAGWLDDLDMPEATTEEDH